MPLVAWLSVAGASALLACGATAPLATPTLSPAAVAAPIGLPPIGGATLVPYTIIGASTAQLRSEMDRLSPTDHGVHFDAFTGHVDFVVASVPTMLEALHAATCATANAAANAVIDRIRQHDIDYDAATNHGATQGARFPLGDLGGGA